jgi:hypothetical protein
MVLKRARVLGLGSWFLIACGGNAPTGALIGAGGSAGQNAGGAAGAGLGGETASGSGGTYIFTDHWENGGAGGAPAVEQNLVEFRIEPDEAVIQLVPGASQQIEYRAFGKFEGAPDVEVELTDRSVFYVPDNYLVASFPATGAATLSTRLPLDADDPVQRGGVLTVQAQAANSNGTLTTTSTTLTVQLAGALSPEPGAPEATPALPTEPDAHFVGTPDPTRAPLLVYPNDGVLMPPNLGRLEVHFERGEPTNELFEVRFESTAADLRYYTRCYSDPTEFEPGACALSIEGEAFELLATSNQGQGSVALSVRGSDENGVFGQSETSYLEFAEQRIDGAVYYWSATSPPSIMRFDFGRVAEPEVFMAPSDVPGNDNSCVGCHALSRQGDKMFFSLGNSADGQLMYVNEMSRATTDPDFFTYNGAENDLPLVTEEQQNRVLTGSFDPAGDAFVAVAPVNDPALDQLLWFHDGNTGERTGSVTLPFVPSQPDWSPLGDSIAMTAIGGANDQTISFRSGGISLLRKDDTGWLANSPLSIVPAAAGKSRFNPVFLPDASLLLYSEVDQSSYSDSHVTACDAGSSSKFCNGYSDPGAKTWAVAPTAGATPVLLANSSAPGVGDTRVTPPQAGVSATDLMDTFPRPAPFLTEHRGTPIGWFTVSSQRRAGLRLFFPNGSVVGDPATQALLWMFAIDPAEVQEGNDGSRRGFFLPFQDLSTSNHMAQWTERIVSADEPPPPPPVPPPPAPPPAPPPPPVLR